MGDQSLACDDVDELGRQDQVHHIALPSERDMTLTVNILLNGVHKESVIDTAAMVTLAREDFFNEINFTGGSGPTCNLTGINNDPIKGKIIKMYLSR